ncbi:MAG: dihydroorotase [Chlamydiales bacterium]|jgi:dihydroorotase
MIRIENVLDIKGVQQTVTIKSNEDIIIDGQGLTFLPGLTDPHVHFRTPGAEYKENWETGAAAAIAGGVTRVFDMPNTSPVTTTVQRLAEKKAIINGQLDKVGIPLRYGLYFGGDRNQMAQIPLAKGQVVGIKVFMGASTGDLLVDDDESLDKIFKIAAEADMIVGVHAEDECTLKKYSETYKDVTTPSVHSKIRDRSAAEKSVSKAIVLSGKYGTRLYVLHISTKEEVSLIRDAKKRGLRVFTETTPHHLFHTEYQYKEQGTKVQMNPPLRKEEDVQALWEGILDGTVDAIGTDHAPHTLEEKTLPYRQAPSGVPGLETLLPLFLDAYSKKRITLEQIVAITRTNIDKLFSLESNDDIVLVDLNLTKEVEAKNLKTKCAWSPFAGMQLKGWPVYTVVKGRVFRVDTEGSKVQEILGREIVGGIA